MRYGTIPGIVKPVSRLIQGTATFEPGEEVRLLNLLDLAFERGINTFDSAHAYGAAKEGLLGQWIRERGVRDKIVIIAKGAHHNSERKRVTPEDIESDLQESMERMQIDYFDAYVLHRDDPDVPVGPIVEALDEQARAGRIGAFGGSNWSVERIQEANAYASAHGLTPFAITSPNFSLAMQEKPPWDGCVSIGGPGGESARRYYAEQADSLAVLPWSSLAGGFFSGRFTRENIEQMSTNGSYYDGLVVRSYCTEDNFERLDRARALGETRGYTPAQIALAYVLCQPMNVFPMMFCDDEKQFDQNIAALEIELTAQEMAYLDLRAVQPA